MRPKTHTTYNIQYFCILINLLLIKYVGVYRRVMLINALFRAVGILEGSKCHPKNPRLFVQLKKEIDFPNQSNNNKKQ